MSEKATVDIVFHESQYTTLRADIDPDHYEKAMGEPLRFSHPDTIEKFIYKNGIHYRIVDEEPDTACPRMVFIDHEESWSYD